MEVNLTGGRIDSREGSFMKGYGWFWDNRREDGTISSVCSIQLRYNRGTLWDKFEALTGKNEGI